MKTLTYLLLGDPVALEIDVEVEGSFYPGSAATREHPPIPETWDVEEVWILRDGRRVAELPEGVLERNIDHLTDALDRAAKRSDPDFRGVA